MRVEIISTGCTNNFLHHHPLNLPHPPRHPLCQFVESLYELVRANVRKVDGNGSPLKNAVFGVYDSEEAAKNEDVPWRVSPPALTGSVRRGEPENKKNMVTIQN